MVETVQLMSWMKGILVVAVMAAMAFFFFRLVREKGRRLAGPERAAPGASGKLGPDYTVFDNVVLPATQGMIRADQVIVGPNGVFVVTIKEVDGRISGRVGDREWEVKSGFKKDTLYNPLWENRKAVNALEEVLGPQPFVPVVAFRRARLRGPLPANVIPLAHLAGFILKNGKGTLFSDKREPLIQKLAALRQSRPTSG